MIKKIVLGVTAVLAIGLFIFLRTEEKKDAEIYSQQVELDEKRRPWAVKQKQLEQELKELEDAYEESKSPNAVTQVLFTELDEQVYTVCYPIMQEYEYVGMLTLSAEEFPGEEGCMTVEQFQELRNAGWGICITWQAGADVEQWWTNMQNKMTVLGIEQEQAVYFPQGTYSAELDETILQLGFSIAVTDTADGVTPLQLQYEEGVWHVGAVGLMSKRPKSWLREAVAQDANITYLVGFEAEAELYNEDSFRSMLNCFDEYEATGEIVVTNVDTAKEHYRNRAMGLSAEQEAEYQTKKAGIEAELEQVKKELEEIDAMY